MEFGRHDYRGDLIVTKEAKLAVDELIARMKGSPYEAERVNEREDGGAVIVLGGRGRGTRINVSPDGKRE